MGLLIQLTCSFIWISTTKSTNTCAQKKEDKTKLYVCIKGSWKWLCDKNVILTRRCIRCCDHGFLYIYYQHPLRSILGIITTHVNHIGVEILISESCCASGYNVIEAWPWRVIGDVEVEGLWMSVRQGAAHWITIEIVDLSGVDDLIWGRVLFDGDRVRKRLNKRWLKYRESQILVLLICENKKW